MKTKTKNRKMWSSPPWWRFALMMLLMWSTLSSSAFAFDLDKNDISVSWYKERGAFKVSVHAVDWTGVNECFDWINFYLDDDPVVTLDASYDGDGNVALDSRSDKVKIYDDGKTWREITTKHWFGNGTNDINFWIYPNATYMKKDIKVNVDFKVRADKLINPTFQQGRYAEWTGYTQVYNYSVDLYDIKREPLKENLEFTSRVNELDRYSQSVANSYYYFTTSTGRSTTVTSSIARSFKGTDRFQTFTGNSQFFKSSIDCGNLTVELTPQEYADGITVYLKSNFNPDVGSSPYWINNVLSNDGVHVGSTSLIKDRKLTPKQDNRNLSITWNMLHPSKKNNLDGADFEVQKLEGNDWVKVGTVNYDSNKDTYTYNYVLSDNELQKGDVDYTFRVWKKRFSSPDINSDMMVSLPITITAHTNYKTVELTNVSSETDENNVLSANVMWEKKGDGVWDERAKLEVIATNLETTVSSSTVAAYDDNEQTVLSLKGCTQYKFVVKVNVGGAFHHESKSKTILTSSNASRKITNLEVSKGYYSDYVTLDWDIPADASDFSGFNITRRDIAAGTSPVAVTQINHTGLTHYSYQDDKMESGKLYEYTVSGYAYCDDQLADGVVVSTIGFTQPYAIVSGRIAYDGDQAVEGVTVSVVGEGDAASNKSLYFEGSHAESNVKLPAELFDLRNEMEHTVQMWIKQNCPENADLNPFIFSKNSSFDIQLYPNNRVFLYYLGLGFTFDDGVLEQNTWMQLTVTTQRTASNTLNAKLYLNGKLVDEQSRSLDPTEVEDRLDNLENDPLVLGGNSTGRDGFSGYIDEFRVWNTILDSTDIARNFDTYLSGKEKNLKGYYRCDEMGCQELFDLSAVGANFNKKDGKMGAMVIHSEVVPSTEQLSIKAVTDEDGNYLINTVPYTSDGIQYNVIPTLGIHSFSPNKRPIFASPSSVVFNGVDFEDKSAFDVSGVVYYEGTDYPVEGVSLYVDDMICSREGEPILTDSEGKFTISVPIGDHSVVIKKQGHTFNNEGRFPADPNKTGTKYTFEQSMSNLTFYDNTLVNISGRVVGGDIEGEKPLGLAQSKNNIGTATLKLSAGTYRLNVSVKQSGTTVTYPDNSENVAVASASSYVNSHAYRKGGNNEEVKYIYITTDSVTGEFSAMVPPLGYVINEVSIPTNEKVDFETLPTIDATNPVVERTDSVVDENGNTLEFKYCTATRLTYHSVPTFTVTDKGNTVGAYGEKTMKYINVASEEEDVPLYSEGAEGIDYNYDYPIFVKSHKYSMQLESFESYTNSDQATPVVDRVPLKDVVVTITNELSASQSVYIETKDHAVAGDIVSLEENQLQLDSLGKATYEWMAGFPNITAPYTRGLNMVYEVNGKEEQWSENGKFKGIVFGDLPSGNNFITSGPDEILMILRDPSGSSSSAYWEEGQTVTTEVTHGGSLLGKAGVNTQTEFGTITHNIVGTPVAAQMTDVGVINTLDVGVDVTTEYNGSSTETRTVTTTKRISTSDNPDYVGSRADVFIGSATNIIFGNARNVGLEKDASGNFSIVNKDVITTGSEFSTGFNYTENYIENVLIPNLYLTRNALIKTVSTSEIASATNTTDDFIYLSTLDKDDERFGSSNIDKEVWGSSATDPSQGLLVGPSYTIIKPATIRKDRVYQDKVLWYNEQIIMWERTMAENEAAKVNAIKNRESYLQENISFDTGASIESSVTTCEGKASYNDWSIETLVILGFDAGVSINETGVRVQIHSEIGARYFGSTTSSTETCQTTGFSLIEDGLNDALSVDVFKAPDGFGAIFATRGGQTSCPYEDAILTKYHKPGTEISAATMRVEIPVVELENSYATDVPTGGTASYNILLRNDSETGDDVWFDLKMIDATNENGARISMDGSVLTEEGRSILVPAGGEIKKTIQLNQTKLDVLEYDNIGVTLVSQCQNDPTGLFPVVADTVFLNAQFVPSCSDIELKIDEPILNMFTSDTLALEMTGFDRSFNSFEAIRVEYKYANDVNWTLGREYVLNEADVTDNKLLLPEGGVIKVKFPMSNNAIFPNGSYQFRLVAACAYGTGEIDTESEIITVTKDMEQPKALGQPSPSDGILSAGDEIAIRFNEDIRSGALNSANNYIVTGILNDARIDHAVALQLNSTAAPVAATEASVLLANGDFSMDMWFNYTQGGTLVEHGSADNKFVVAIDEAGKLVVTIGKEQYTSTEKIIAEKWNFLTLSYSSDVDGYYLSASVANDASTVTLFKTIDVVEYTGVGRLTVGRDMQGAMHEITLWNKARTAVEAISEKDQSKFASTPNLIGYWKLTEGNGTVAYDLARNRHMTLEGDTWYMSNVNKAAHLAGNGYLNLDISTASAGINDNYALEMWFRGDAQTDATLWSANSGVGIKFDSEGKLALIQDDAEVRLSNTDYLDNVWHHIAFNVLRGGSAIVYVDGKAIKQLSADVVAPLQGHYLVLGATYYREEGTSTYAYKSHFTGEVDEVRFWLATLNGQYLSENRYSRINMERVAGLAAYYPFEKSALDANNQVVTAFNLDDLTREVTTTATTKDVTEASNAPALKAAPALTNIQFSSVASEREIILTLEEEASRIEGTTINFTVQNVRDMNGNITQPTLWSAYINCNRLGWSEDELTFAQQSGDVTTFTVSVENLGSVSENWSISNMPMWLSASKEQDNIDAQVSQKVTFTTSESMPIGTYEETIYLYGNDGIYVPLTITVAVTAERPAWSVNPADYESNMSLIAQLILESTPSYDANDIVAAFAGNECVGIASPVYYSRYDSYYTTMNIYGSEEGQSQAITFKVWDASTGNIYPVVTPSEEIVYLSNKLYGSITSPVELVASNLLEASLPLDKGWNWISFGLNPEDRALESIFAPIHEDLFVIKSMSEFAQPNGDGEWIGALKAVETTQMYNVKMTEQEVLNLVGTRVEAASTPITVIEGWNWVGYTPLFPLSIGDAMAGLNPVTGDVVKGQDEFSIYDGYEWFGELRTLNPNEGYRIQSQSSEERTFTYPSSSPYSNSMLRSASLEDEVKEESSFGTINRALFPSNMTMVAIVKKDGIIASGADVGICDQKGIYREARFADEDGYVYLTIMGDGIESNLEVHVKYAGQDYVIEGFKYVDNAHHGSIADPYEINLDRLTLDMDADYALDTRISPNPTKGMVTIVSNLDIAKIELCNAVGATILEVAADERKVDLSGYADGIYFLILTDQAGNKYTERIVKY